MGEGMAEQKGWLLLTNDDGIEAEGFRLLVKALHEAGYPLVVFAPSSNHSATGMRINLMTPMNLRSREDLASTWSLDVHQTPAHLFELDGTPCDTMIVALDGGLEHLVPGVRPQLVVSVSTSDPIFRKMPIIAEPWGPLERQVSTVCLPSPHRSLPLTPRGWKQRF